MTEFYVVLGVVAFLVVFKLFTSWLRLRRAEFIRTYKLPPGLLRKLTEHHPGLSRKDAALVSRGLRQYFVAYLMSGKKFVSMPSRIADDLWHEFILYTREYQRFCRLAFGGFMHHTPAVVLGPSRRDNEGLRRVWWYSCKYENIDPVNPSRVPLLFALDSKLNVPNGFHYHPDCEQLRKGGDGTVYCGGDFSSTSVDGSTAGFGDTGSGTSASSSSGDSSSGGDSGGGCGGGGD